MITLLLLGCMPAATVRTADVLAPGGLAGGMNTAGFAWGFGTATLQEDGETIEVGGNGARSGSDSASGASIAYAYAAATEWELRVGVAPRVELGARYGFGRVGLEARFAALDEDLGARLSLAPGVMVARQAWTEGRPLWWRVGFDASRRRQFRRHDYWTPAIGLWASGGGVRHIQHMLGKEYGYPITDCKEGWPGTPCGSPDPHTRGLLNASRDEVALSLPASVSLQTLTKKGGGNLTVGVVPQFTAWSSEPRDLECYSCRAGVTALDYDGRWLVTLEIGVTGMSTKGMALE